MAKLLLIATLFLSACGGEDFYQPKTETSRYILRNHSNYELKVVFSVKDGVGHQSVVAQPGEELVFLEKTLKLMSERSGVIFPAEVFIGEMNIIAYYDGADALVYSGVDDVSIFQEEDPFRLSGGITVYPFTISVTDSDIGARL